MSSEEKDEGKPSSEVGASRDATDNKKSPLEGARMAAEKHERVKAEAATRKRSEQKGKLDAAERKEAIAGSKSARRQKNAPLIGLVVGIALGVLLSVGLVKTSAFGLIPHSTDEAEKGNSFQATVDTSMLTSKIEDSAQLVTAKMSYDGALRVETGSIPIINKSKFWIVYKGSVGAGIDVNEVTVAQDGDTVLVTIPHSTLTDPIQIDPSSVQFFTDESPVFSNDENDMNQAMQLAAEDMQSKIDMSDLYSRADDHAVAVIHQLLDDQVGDLKVEVQFQSDGSDEASTANDSFESDASSEGTTDGSESADTGE